MHVETAKYILLHCLHLLLRLGSHCSAYELTRFCRYLSAVHIAPCLYKIQIQISLLCVYLAHSNRGYKILFYSFYPGAQMRGVWGVSHPPNNFNTRSQLQFDGDKSVPLWACMHRISVYNTLRRKQLCRCCDIIYCFNVFPRKD